MPTPDNVPNLDAASVTELKAFWLKHQHGANMRELFPEGGQGSINATRDLANYAINKLTAISLRLAGNISLAKQYEDICDRIYDQLPDWAKGW